VEAPPFLTLALGGDDGSAFHPSKKNLWHSLNRREKKGSVHVLDVVETRKISPTGMELRINQLLA
jgi:hypothetical protein